jgi:hypothetical protein
MGISIGDNMGISIGDNMGISIGDNMDISIGDNKGIALRRMWWPLKGPLGFSGDQKYITTNKYKIRYHKCLV